MNTPDPDSHGHPVDDAAAPLSPVTQLREELSRWGWRLRRQALPLIALGVTHGLGVAAATVPCCAAGAPP